MPHEDTDLSFTLTKSWYKTLSKARQILQKITTTLKQVRLQEWCNTKAHYIRIGKYGNIARMINPKPHSGPIAGSYYPSKLGEPTWYAINDIERQEASLLTHNSWIGDPPGTQNCHFLNKSGDDVGPCGISLNYNEFDAAAQWKYLDGLLHQKVDNPTVERIIYAYHRLPTLFEQINTTNKIIYPFKYDSLTGEFLYPEVEKQIRKNIAKGNGKAKATGFAIPVFRRLPKPFIDAYLQKCKLQLPFHLLDIGKECSLRICISKLYGGVRPLTVGHDNNVFLNGLAQQGLQKEIARLGILPGNLCSHQKGKGCNDATIVDCIVKEVALQTNLYYLVEIGDDAKKMFDRLYVELQAALLLLAGAGRYGFMEWQCANVLQRTNKVVTDIFIAMLKYQCGLPQGNGFSVEIANLYAMFLLMWWNKDPINPTGTITPFESTRHAFPLIAGGITKLVSSMAYVDDAKQFVAMLKREHSVETFFSTVQAYCDLLAKLSLVIKMGRNVKKMRNLPVQHTHWYTYTRIYQSSMGIQ